MNGKTLVLLLLAGTTFAWSIHRPGNQPSKRVIGQTERVEIAEASMELLGRVDTGAASTSVHAEAVEIDGNMVSFVLAGRDGRRVSMREPIAKTATVRNAERSEKRVYVEMTLQHAGLAKRVLVNLNDRAGLTYPLLLGRNWLKDDFMVDVTRTPAEPTTGSIGDLPGLAASE